MSVRELVRAYVTHPSIQVYAALAAASTIAALSLAASPTPVVLSALAVALLYPLVEYLIHRFVLHARVLYRSPLTARLWKRIHFDHHQEPHRLDVLFGALWTTLPTIVAITVPIGWLIGGKAGAAAALATGLVAFSFYEFCHCVQHLNYRPRSAFLRRIKRLHLAHHFHNETGNFGITGFALDRLFKTYYDAARDIPRSAHTFDLGYDDCEAARYPWVATMSGRNRRSPAASGAEGERSGVAARADGG